MTLRYAAILFASVLAMHGRELWHGATGRARDARAESGNVILVVADGLRWQEVFRGADPALLEHADAETRRHWLRPTVAERRAALMPFVWGTIAREGQLIGNRDLGSAAIVTNPMKFSYPGYNEMLVGYPDARIDRNDFGPNPNVTVFEWLKRRDVGVVAFGMWDTFRDIFNVGRSGIPVLDFDTDAETHAAAMAHLRRQSPGAMFVGFGATDDLAHRERYDLVLSATRAIDGYVADLWAEVQASPRYRGRTTLILVADHGRGRTANDWMHHGDHIAGSDETWFAVIGPAIPARGEARGGRATLAQTAASVAAALRLDYTTDIRRAAPALFEVGASAKSLSLLERASHARPPRTEWR